MKLLEVGSLIKTLLSDMTISKELHGVFPSVAPDKTPFPFVVYKRSGTTPEGDKVEYYRYGTASVELTVVDSDYAQSLRIASAISDEMPTCFRSEKWVVSDIGLTNAIEDFIDDVYIQVLIYNITIDKL